MGLLELPPEILRSIIIQAVTVRGVKRGLRLRLVNSNAPYPIQRAQNLMT
jgi:hypothetical protein